MKVAVLSFAHERAGTYARLLRELPGVQLVTADPDAPPGNPGRGRAAADRLGVSYLDSWDEVFATSPDAVLVTAETDGRRELVERAAAAGAAVLCEYPLAAKEIDAKSMVDTCDEAGVRLTVAAPACFCPAFATVRQGVADGLLGALTTVTGSHHCVPDACPDGALAANAAPLLHLVDAVLDGEPAEQVYAQANSVLSGVSKVESAALVSVRYPSGVVVTIDCSARPDARPDAPALSFIGERASVEYDARPRMLGGHVTATAAQRWEPGGAEPLLVMLQGFLTACETGAAAGPDGTAAVRTQRIVQAAYESVHTGQPVALTP